MLLYDELGAFWGRWWRVFYEKKAASQRLIVTLSLMTASTSGPFLWRNRINGRDGEGSVLETSNNFGRIRQSEFLIRKAEGRRQNAEVLRRAGQSVT